VKVIFSGTGTSQGIPVIGCNCRVCQSKDPKDNRLRTAVIMQWSDGAVAVDAGPDFRQQMLRAGIQSLDALFMTHEHNDHIAGLDDIRPYYFQNGAPLPVFATQRVQGEIKNRFAYFFDPNPYPGSPRINCHTVAPYTPFTFNGRSFMPVLVDHGSLPVIGYRSDDFCYVTDAKHLPQETLDALKGVKVLVLNALRKRPHNSHLNLAEAIAIAEHLQADSLYLTHISHEMGLHEEAQADLPTGVNFAYDGLVIDV
jgi:phosphoribosyl 1,2-cyclic phosphate phosphodiesterase